VLAGQKVTATGRTRDVSGLLTFEGSTLTEAQFTAQLGGVKSDRSNRDGQFRGRIMDVEQFPTSTFTLTQPIEVTAVPAEAEIVTLSATGDFTLRGTTKSVTFDLKAFQAAGRITVTGEIPIVFAEWGIPNPSFGPPTPRTTARWSSC
jgi:polyisoprenoid-binding protein YceI